ncbi:MAG: hypothetical protein AB7P49_02365 [Bdellovibrionales bacterium]
MKAIFFLVGAIIVALLIKPGCGERNLKNCAAVCMRRGLVVRAIEDGVITKCHCREEKESGPRLHRAP